MAERNKQLSAEQESVLLNKWFDVQTQEMRLQAERLKLEEKELINNHDIAKITIDRQAIDRTQQREFIQQCRKDTFLFISGISSLIAALVIAALWLGKDQIAMEIIKDIIFLLSGGAGGYAIGKNKNKETDTEQ